MHSVPKVEKFPPHRRESVLENVAEDRKRGDTEEACAGDADPGCWESSADFFNFESKDSVQVHPHQAVDAP